MDPTQSHSSHNQQLLSSPPTQHHQQQQQQQPHDVLAEARKNLQALIDSGISRDLLHQLVDGGAALPLATIPTQSTLVHPSQQQQLHLQQQQQQHQSPPQPQQTLPSQAQQPPLPSFAVPPPPQCAPPPPPPSAQLATQQYQAQNQQMLSPNPTNSPTNPPNGIKSELDLEHQTPDDVPPMLASYSGAAASFMHRPRISVSSTSSGSSGHASIFSNMSGMSGMSAQSAASWASSNSTYARMQAPLPMPPQITSPTGPPVMNATQPMGTAASISKQNIYWCTSCETSFKRKYDWKRHEDEFHERWRKYPCPEPGCNRSFWGSNSFNQHHKQCHGCTTCPHAEKVVKFLRKRKYWACGFCSALHPARERHVEHVARHFESGMTKGEWMHSRVVYGLLHQPLIHEAWEALVNSKQSEYAGRRPRFSWHPSKTGRAQGFLEKENHGQLQDLLEFFSGEDGDAQWIASVAYDLADIVMDNIQLTPPHFPSNAAMTPYQDPRMSFSSLPPQQTRPSMLPSSDISAHGNYASGYQNSVLVPSQPYGRPTGSGPSPPESTTHSPLASNHSPITTSHTRIKRDPESSHIGARSQEAGDGLMDFEYSPAPVAFEDWESLNSQSLNGQLTDEPTPNQQNSIPQTSWGMVGYYSDPRIVS